MLGLGLVGLVLVAYWPVLYAGWMWDDGPLIALNRYIQAGRLDLLWTRVDMPDYYPVTWTAFQVEYWLFHTWPMGYHAVNILMHMAATLLLWQVLQRLRVPGAWLAAALFAVHPVTVATVAWISEQKNTLSFIFYALTVWLYLDRKNGWSVLTFAIALLCKTSGVMLPLILLLCTWWRREGSSNVLPHLLLSAAAAVFSVWFQQHNSIGEVTVRPEGVMSRALAATWCIWFYLEKAIMPIHLSLIYPRWNVDPTWWPAFLPAAALLKVAFLMWLFWERGGRSIAFAAACYVLLLLPVLGLFPISFMVHSLVADHWQYLALPVPISLLVAAAACRIPARWHLAVGTLVVGCFLLLTCRQASTYYNEETIWSHTLAENPNAWMAHYNYAYMLYLRGDTGPAIAEYERTLALHPDYAFAVNTLAWIRSTSAQARWRDPQQGLELAHRACALSHANEPEMVDTLAAAYAACGRFPEAVRTEESALRLLDSPPFQYRLQLYRDHHAFRE